MAVAFEEALPIAIFEHCKFPTIARRGKRSSSFGAVEVAPFLYPEGHIDVGFPSVSKELLQAAWAVLLRNYIGNEQVSFGVLSTFQTSGERKFDATEQDFNIDYEILVYQYLVSGNCLLDDFRASGCWSISEQELQETPMNTAVHFIKPNFTKTDRLNGNHFLPDDFRADTVFNHFDLVLEVQHEPFFPGAILRYRIATISAQYAQSIVNSLHMILKSVTTDTLPKGDFTNFISDNDQRNIISWNPKASYRQMTCMHYLVEAVARLTPHAEAVFAWDGSLTYSQLNTISSVAAHKLGGMGVGPGVFVPFAFEKSLWAVVSMLAILKAGGAFVPLDPNSPKARIKEILASTNAKVIITSDSFASKFADLETQVIVLSSRTISADQTSCSSEFYSTAVQSTDPIFVLFTSGSTGKPKGIVHEHGAICTHAIAHGEVMGYHGARVLQFAAHTFDVAIMDIFTTLIFGGCICTPSEEERQNNIIGAINNMKADYAILTPSFARLIKPSEAPTLKTVAVGGEALPQDSLEGWLKNGSLIQIYGPAEVGICLSLRMRYNHTRAETVGFPLPNCSCWLVRPDDPHRLVPIGAIGELVVGGPSLAREYLGDENKTRASFLENLSWAKSLKVDCNRFFRTGDLLRYNTDCFDGSFDFVGRKDAQIKLRGQRIEPAEIEHHMATIAGVAISMVTRPEQGCFAGQLVVVVEMHSDISSRVRTEPISLADNQSLTLEGAQVHLSRFLPSYMIPTVCLVVRSMPFVPSLKINRKLVEAWLMDMASAPSNIAEAALADLRLSPLPPDEDTANILSTKVAGLVAPMDWKRRVSLENQNFVLQATGIDSIQIISLSMFLRKTYKVNIPIAKLLNPTVTIRGLADMIDHCNEPSHSYKTHPRVDIVRDCEAINQILLGSIRELSQTFSEGVGISERMSERTPLPQNVFVTGVTGYLGSAILQKLMKKPNVNVFALVRCSQESLGLQRIVDSGKKMGWWQEFYASRIQIWKGDLTQKNLGLDSDHMKSLRATRDARTQIHAIIHNGAKVHYSSDYQTLRAANISSTSILLEITASQVSNFVYVSGGQLPNEHFNIDVFPSSPNFDFGQANGYTQTKLVSELLVQKCTEHALFRGKSLCIIKPGYIIGSAKSGIANQSDFIWRLISSCVKIGAYNRDEIEHWLFIADVDHVADNVISPLFDGGNGSSHVRRVLDGLRFSDLWVLLRSDFGYELEALDSKEWMERLRGAVWEEGEKHLLFPLMHILEGEGGAIGSVKEPNGITADSIHRVKNAIKSNLRHLIQVGFIPRAK